MDEAYRVHVTDKKGTQDESQELELQRALGRPRRRRYDNTDTDKDTERNGVR